MGDVSEQNIALISTQLQEANKMAQNEPKYNAVELLTKEEQENKHLVRHNLKLFINMHALHARVISLCTRARACLLCFKSIFKVTHPTKFSLKFTRI